MRTVSLRSLLRNSKEFDAILRFGETVQLTRNRRIIAQLVPEPAPVRSMPDFSARLKKIYGDRILEPSGAEIISQDRERF
jgi:antitoxin (DNA-binding transcriptional repressor) of toxin-antitoxin stability system